VCTAHAQLLAVWRGCSGRKQLGKVLEAAGPEWPLHQGMGAGWWQYQQQEVLLQAAGELCHTSAAVAAAAAGMAVGGERVSSIDWRHKLVAPLVAW
jgi:hypothetical protein